MRLFDETPRWQGARKLEPLHLVVRQSVTVREFLSTLSDDILPDQRLTWKAVEQFELAAACRNCTTVSREMLQGPASCGPVLEAIGSMLDFTLPLWLQTETGQYLTTARYHKMFLLKFPTVTCP